MFSGSIRIAPYLKTGILHSDRAFCGRLGTLLKILGVNSIYAMQSGDAFTRFIGADNCDLAFIEIADDFDAVWNGLPAFREGMLIVGVSEAQCGNDWLWAIRRGADTILLKPYYPCLLREMLAQLVESPAARRCRIVQFPATGGRVDRTAEDGVGATGDIDPT